MAGNTVVNADVSVAGHKSLQPMAVVSIGVIFVMLLMVYRSVVTTILALVIVGIELFAAPGVTATLGNLNIIGLTPYAVSMVTMLSIAAGTDYVIFLLGRYQEARSVGQDREVAFYTAYRWRVARDPGFGVDHRGCVYVPDHVHVAVLQVDGIAVRDRAFGDRGGGADPGAGDPGGRVPVRSVRC